MEFTSYEWLCCVYCIAPGYCVELIAVDDNLCENYFTLKWFKLNFFGEMGFLD